jgi:hypothetical protein
MKDRYAISYSDIWLTIFNDEYQYANQLIYLANKAFFIDKNFWASYTDSFNDLLLRMIL